MVFYKMSKDIKSSKTLCLYSLLPTLLKEKNIDVFEEYIYHNINNINIMALKVSYRGIANNIYYWTFTKENHRVFIDILIKYNINVNLRDFKNQTMLHLMAKNGDYDLLERVLNF